jgi:dihydrodipicolinate synthase/N-acetylneuraminate lyase
VKLSALVSEALKKEKEDKVFRVFCGSGSSYFSSLIQGATGGIMALAK